jgi:hypothetical protein
VIVGGAFASVVVVVAFGAAASGCAKLVGASFDDPSPPGAAAACSVTQVGDAFVRLGDFVPTTDRHDFCLTRQDGSSPLDGVPAIGQQGIGYEQVQAPTTLPAGSYRVEVQPAGQGCGGQPLTRAQLCLGAATTTTVLLLGDGVASYQLGTFPESTAPAQDAPTRFVDAIEGLGALDFGHADAPALPAQLSPLFTNVGFGATSAGGGPVDANGYATITPETTAIALGAAPAGTTAAALVTAPVLQPAHRYTIVAAGSATDIRFPEELFVCDETLTDGALTSCGGVASDVTVDSINAFVFGPFALHEAERKIPLYQAISNLDADVLCVTGIPPDTEKVALYKAAAAGGRFFIYAAWTNDTLATPVDDPTDQHGAIPPPWTTPPCGDAAAVTDLDATFACIEASCATRPNDPTATVIEDPIECIATSCLTPAGTIIKQAPACWMCSLGQIYSRTSFADARTACTTEPDARLTWGGQSPIILISRLPLANRKQWVLPAAFERIGIVSATVTPPNGASFDVHCAQLTSPGDGSILPYVGQYGNGLGSGADAWRQELLLQSGKLVHYVEQASGATRRRAILAGEWQTGPTVPNVIGPSYPESYAVLSAAFPLAIPPGQIPECTVCQDNPIWSPPGQTPLSQPSLTNFAMLSGIPVTDVRAASVLLKENVVPFKTYTIPVSPFYDFRTTVRIRP